MRGMEDFEEGFAVRYRRCLALASRILGDRVAAEDVAAEALARAYLRWDRLDVARRDGWVLRVTSNLAIDQLRRHPPRLPERDVAPEQDVVAVRLALRAALLRLPRRQREVIALRYLSDMSEADVAVAMGISAGSVKTHLHRGLAALRRTLGREDLEETLANP